MKTLFLLLSLSLSLPVYANNQTLGQLLTEVKKAQQQERTLNHARESEFLNAKQQQQQLLKTAQTTLAQQESLSQQLKTRLQANEQQLTELETQLKERSGVLSELFGVAKQTAGDLSAELQHSLISAQYPNRTEKLQVIANNKALPTIEQLETLWFSLQHEMTESAKIVRFQSTLETANGTSKTADIIRVGAFNALGDGGYLRYSPETQSLISLARQPNSSLLQLANEFAQTTATQSPLAVDPTRGVMLSMLIQTPDTQERIQQGGVIGYIILGLGLIGLLLALYRFLVLWQTGQKMQRQITAGNANSDNPLGRVLIATEQASSQDTDTLELILDEAITREVPALERGLSIIKLFAAVAPLLGLLGTVTGMIATFQSISLFGTGDPKLMADGISQALVTTMLGLCVAIPLLFLYHLVAARSKTLVQILDEQSAGIMSRRADK